MHPGSRRQYRQPTEVESLREERDDLLELVASLRARCEAAEAEVERLKGANLLWEESHTLLKMDFNDAEARSERLEAALREIAAEGREYPDHDDGGAECAECNSYFQTDDAHSPAPECWPCSSTLLEKARVTARAALADEGGGK